MRGLPLLLCVAMAVTALAEIKDPVATEVWEPRPRKITGAAHGAPPSDAIVLFDGLDLSEWKSQIDGSNAKWQVVNGDLVVVPGTGAILTTRMFGDIQLHIEWSSPTVIVGAGQGRGNSGVFLQERYEVQILDSFESKTYSNGQAGAIYKQSIPLVNATAAPGEWNVYDMIYRAPVFNGDGIKTRSGYLTLIHNGALIQNHVELQGTTEYIGLPRNVPHGDASIMLQDHSHPIRFRNIWVREL